MSESQSQTGDRSARGSVWPSLRQSRRKVYADLTHDELERRLSAAEDVALMVGWTSSQDTSPRGKALFVLWRRWYSRVGSDFHRPAAHRHLSDRRIETLAGYRHRDPELDR